MLTTKEDVTLVIFILSIIFVIHAVTIRFKLPHFGTQITIPINLTTAPIVAIAILWAAQCINPKVIRDGIVGTEDVKPYNILILFFSLAYMAITLDVTGVLRAAAYWVSNKGGSDGRKLYFYFYVLLTLLSVILGNDPVILSGTVFLVYYTQVVDELEPLPWLITEFAAANTASMVLFVGNPTNVVICEGFRVNNAAFTAYTILPFIACNIACFVALAFQYIVSGNLPKRITPTTLDVRSALQDPVSAWVGSILLGSCLIVIIVVSFFGIDVWIISLPFAVAKLIFDFAWDYYKYTLYPPIIPISVQEEFSSDRKSIHGVSASIDNKSALAKVSETASPDGQKSEVPPSRNPMSEGGVSVHFNQTEEGFTKGSPQSRYSWRDFRNSSHTASTPRHRSMSSRDSTLVSSALSNPKLIDSGIVFKTDVDRQGSYPSTNSLPINSVPMTPSTPNTAFTAEPERQQTFSSDFPPPPTVSIPPTRLEDVPISGSPQLVNPAGTSSDRLYPRLMSRFPIFFTALPRLPFALVPFAFSQFILIEGLEHQGWINVFAGWLVRASHRQMHPTIWLVGVLGVFLCNISGTNIGATILLTKVVRTANMPPHVFRAAAISLAVASNIGAVSFTFSASLAGLLWRTILSQKGIKVSQTEFAKWNLLPLAAMTSVGLAVVSIEMAVLYKGAQA